MGKTGIIIGTHNHLPLGRSEARRAAVPGIAEALPRRALPLPGFPVTLHYSGILMEWLEESPSRVPDAARGDGGTRPGRGARGAATTIPILPLIPTNDKLGQLEKMTTWLRVRFETRPRGCWIVEKVWEQSLASVLRASGMDYTFVDDGQFAIAGVDGDDLFMPVHHGRPGEDHLASPRLDRLSRRAARRRPRK